MPGECGRGRRLPRTPGPQPQGRHGQWFVPQAPLTPLTKAFMCVSLATFYFYKSKKWPQRIPNRKSWVFHPLMLGWAGQAASLCPPQTVFQIQL